MYEDIYEQNKGLLRSMARRYARACALDRAVSEEDLTQAGFIGLVKAAESFDEGGGKTWASWAGWHIQRELENALGMREGRFTRAHTAADTLDRPLADLDEEGMTALDALADETLVDPDEALMLDELRRDVREAVARLEDGEQRRVMQQCKLEGRSYGEVAADMGISLIKVQRLFLQARTSLARDRRLRELAKLDELTLFHARKGVQAFNRDWTSVTEGAALWRIGQRERMEQKMN